MFSYGHLMWFTLVSSGMAAPATDVHEHPARSAPANSYPMTPHCTFGSSIGVVGCLVDTDRIAYWPFAPNCNNNCYKVSYGGRSVHVLHLDTSGGAHDLSYDAFLYLYKGYGVRQTSPGQPAVVQDGTSVGMAVEKAADMSSCASLYTNGKHSVAALNPEFVSGCLAREPNSWIARNYAVINVDAGNGPFRGYLNDVCSFVPPENNIVTCGKTQATHPIGTACAYTNWLPNQSGAATAKVVY